MDMKERVIVALDFATEEEAWALVETLGEEAVFYKLGLELFLYSQGRILERLKAAGKKVFLDLKFHDIPNTTGRAASFAAQKGVDFFNVHATGGRQMMERVLEETRALDASAKVLAVTILTSFSEETLQEVFHSRESLGELALSLAKLAKESGLSGVVCSPWEAGSIKEACGKDFLTVCPGVRPLWAATNDQKRIMTAKKAIEAGCDYLVIGRPVTKNEDPKAAMRSIVAEMEEAKC